MKSLLLRITSPKLFLFIFLFFIHIYAQSFYVASYVDKDKVFIGDRIQFTIDILFDPNIKITKPGPSLNLGEFEIKDFKIIPPVLTNGKVLDRITYTIVAFDTGEMTIPGAEVTGDIDGKKITKTTDSIKIYIASIATKIDAKDELIDINEPLTPMGATPTRYIFYIFGPIFILLLSALIYFFRDKIFPKKKSPLTSYDKALLSLSNLSKNNFFDNKQFKEFYYEFSIIIRTYIEDNTNIPCTTLTTRQIKNTFQKDPIENHQLYTDIFTYSDSVKFAKFVPDKEVTFNYLSSIKEILRRHKRKAELDLEEKSNV